MDLTIDEATKDAVIAEAMHQMEQAFAGLPKDYFQEKNAVTFLFNNIERVYAKKPPLTELTKERAYTIIRDTLVESRQVGLYAGVPWCAQICSFCDRAFSIAQGRDVYVAYIGRIHKELDILRERVGLPDQVSTVYFGGGTPTILSADLFDRYINGFLQRLSLVERASITCEAFPLTLTEEKLEVLKDAGVNRISLGIQTLDDKIRENSRLLGTSDKVMRKVTQVMERFDVVNVDLIYGFPGQNMSSWFDTVYRVANTGIPSITLYRLEVRPQTGFAGLYKKMSHVFSDEVLARRQYFLAKQILEQYGYIENPLGWWIKEKLRETNLSWEQHMTRWRTLTPYFGTGQGAWSHTSTFYYENYSRIGDWEAAIDSGHLPIEVLKMLDARDAYLFRLMRALRTQPLLNLPYLLVQAGSLADDVKRVVDRNIGYGLMILFGDDLSLTDGGKALVHWIIDEFIEELGNRHVE